VAKRYKEVKEQIFDEMIKLEPNSRIPSRTKLCEKYMVSRTTIDRAIEELVKEGHLYSVDGSGTFVTDLRRIMSVPRKVLNLGVLLPNIMSDTYPGILRGIEDVAQQHDMNVIICNTDHDYEKESSYIKRLINSKVNGIIVIPVVVSKERRYDTYSGLHEAHIPIVFCNRSDGIMNGPIVCSNDFYGAYLATSHLIEKGYRKIAYIEGIHYRTSIDRCQGYFAALDHHGLPIDEALVKMLPDPHYTTKEEGRELMDLLFKEELGLDAAFCFNDQIACGAEESILAHGLRISDDIGLIGYDNTQICESMPTKLSSVSFRTYEIGRRAAEIMYDMIEHPEKPVTKLSSFCPQLVIRDSCLGKKTLTETAH